MEMFAEPHFCLPNIFGTVGRMEPDWKRLGEHVLARRTSRGWSQKAVYDHGGPSDTTLSKIELGEWRPTRGVADTLAKLDKGMKWVPGSASTTLGGGDPKVLAPDPSGGDNDSSMPTDTHNPPKRGVRTMEEMWTAAPQMSDAERLVIELAVATEEVNERMTAAFGRGTPGPDSEQFSQFVLNLQRFVLDFDRLSQRVHDAALEVAGRDAERLQQLEDAVRASHSGPILGGLSQQFEKYLEAAVAWPTQTSAPDLTLHKPTADGVYPYNIAAREEDDPKEDRDE